MLMAMEDEGLDDGARQARATLQQNLGVPVEVLDTGGAQGACDLRYSIEGRSVVVEVKRILDPAYRALDDASRRTGYTKEPRLTRAWDVRLSNSARLKRARRHVVDLLLYMESVGIDSAPPYSQIDEHLEEALEKLRVTSLSSFEPTDIHPPGFYVMPEPWGGAVPAVDQLPDYVTRVLSSTEMTKLRTQLARAPADERHAFLILGWENMEVMPLEASSTGVLPTEPPTLPEGIDGVWLTSTLVDTRVVAWLPSLGWIEGDTG